MSWRVCTVASGGWGVAGVPARELLVGVEGEGYPGPGTYCQEHELDELDPANYHRSLAGTQLEDEWLEPTRFVVAETFVDEGDRFFLSVVGDLYVHPLCAQLTAVATPRHGSRLVRVGP